MESTLKAVLGFRRTKKMRKKISLHMSQRRGTSLPYREENTMRLSSLHGAHSPASVQPIKAPVCLEEHVFYA